MKPHQIRNWNIARLKGILPSITRLIPEDVVSKFPAGKLLQFQQLADEIYQTIDDAKQPKFVCLLCRPDLEDNKPTRNKKAVECDLCGAPCFGNNKLYLYKEK